MKYVAWKSIAAFLIFCLAGSLSRAIDVCANSRKGGQEPAAYLIGPKGLLMSDGVNLGDIPLAANVNDERFKIDTNHLVVVFPKKIYIKTPWLGMGYGVDLIPVKPSICAEAMTYRVVLNWVRRKGEVRPYRFDAPFPRFALTDELGYEEDVSSPYKFRPVVTGRMVNP
ncbi:MAG: hypothetical protein PGN26_12915 [Xylophilus ampelinus]